ncbi:hypothetical protein HMPREF9075_00793 [Capnocytophaga sp. oral taxon 332 str. F0381]|uniref:hypothetical protein n=1 Tax=Capnocytophaga sp. oral taxon 332 TaxID=712213 RepID=UPI0002A25B54|nr:hypothetical protein [Capnocytophaga sp. oral taxon 332]EKY11147.1 hypothetical protein HMPREF9075_00793 [Capnocytophaga sp. oral taxon 332 str. F0381]
MYKQVKRINDIGRYIYTDGFIYGIKKEEGKRYFQELSLGGEVLWQSKESNVYDYYANEEVIIFNLKTTEGIFDVLIYNRKTKKIIFKGEIELYLFSSRFYDKNILYNINKNRVLTFDILKGGILQEKEISLKGITAFFTYDYIVRYDDIYIYIYVKRDYSLLWQQDIQDFFPEEEELSILEIYSYKDTFIIIARVGIVCLSQKDGSLIWKCDHYARTMEIVGHYGYVCTSLSFYRVDLDTGEFYNYNRKYSRLPDFEYNGENHWPSGHRVVYHKGLLWYDVHTSKHPFIIAIDPETATYQWIYQIKDTYEDIEEIRFYDNKMFVTDTGNNLFIYEEEI